MLSKDEVLIHNTIESEAIRHIDAELLKYYGNLIEFNVDSFPQNVLDKLKVEYEKRGWTIKQKNRHSAFAYGGNGPNGMERHWRVE